MAYNNRSCRHKDVLNFWMWNEDILFSLYGIFFYMCTAWQKIGTSWFRTGFSSRKPVDSCLLKFRAADNNRPISDVWMLNIIYITRSCAWVHAQLRVMYILHWHGWSALAPKGYFQGCAQQFLQRGPRGGGSVPSFAFPLVIPSLYGERYLSPQFLLFSSPPQLFRPISCLPLHFPPPLPIPLWWAR